jgi:hypothetical protein
MKLRSLVLAGVLATAGVLVTAQKADAQVTFSFGYNNPYTYSYGFNPYTYNSFYTPYSYGGVGNPYVRGFGNPYVGGFRAPYYSYRDYVYNSPFYGSGYTGYRYVSPSIYGPGGYQYRYWRWR